MLLPSTTMNFGLKLPHGNYVPQTLIEIIGNCPLSTRKISHPFLAELHDLHTQLVSEGKKIVFMWVPGHMGIRGNIAVDRAAKDAL
ncbi:RNase H family protein, partial [Acinetobacter baumannii]|uniref:RNase H family protein n=1 Tax=Acinetobacter baumannii TaxID=470 RepID=UPI003396EED7